MGVSTQSQEYPLAGVARESSQLELTHLTHSKEDHSQEYLDEIFQQKDPIPKYQRMDHVYWTENSVPTTSPPDRSIFL